MINNYSKLNELLDFLYEERKYEPKESGMAQTTKLTYDNSKAFLRLLLENQIPSPRISPEGDGAIIFAWVGKCNDVLVVVEDDISYVKYAGSDDAQYRDFLPFDGKEIPKELLEALITS